MNALIPETWRSDKPALPEPGKRKLLSPQPQRGRWLSLLLGLLPLVLGTGGALLVSFNRHL
jgi:hypothetical protein